MQFTGRLLLTNVFHRIGGDRVTELLQGKQSDREFIPTTLNKALLEWSERTGGREAKARLNNLLLEHRQVFRSGNSVWARATQMMSRDRSRDIIDPVPDHIRCIDYLTFNELSIVVMDLFGSVFPTGFRDGNTENRVRYHWRDSLAKVQRLRNDVAHLRNIEFRDMEGLAAMVERMRTDVIEYTNWRQPPCQTNRLEL